MKRVLSSILVVTVAASLAGCMMMPSSQQRAGMPPGFDKVVFHSLTTNSFEAFVQNPMREQMKTRYALALTGYWIADHDLKAAKAYGELALELARKNEMKMEEAQGLLCLAILADASGQTSEAIETVRNSIAAFKEAGSKSVIVEALLLQGSLEQKSGMIDESISTYREIQSVAAGPNASAIQSECRNRIATLEAGRVATNANPSNAQAAAGNDGLEDHVNGNANSGKGGQMPEIRSQQSDEKDDAR